MHLMHIYAALETVKVDCTCGHDNGQVLWRCWPIEQGGGLKAVEGRRSRPRSDMQGGEEHDARDGRVNVTTLMVYF